MKRPYEDHRDRRLRRPRPGTVRRALELGHTVTALSRTTDTLPKDASLTTIAGSALDLGDVSTSISGKDAVLITLGTGNSTMATTLYSDAATVIITAATKLGISAPLITVTGFGAGDSAAYQNLLMRTIMKRLLGRVYANKTQMVQMLAASGLDGTPAIGPGHVRVGPGGVWVQLAA